MGVETSGRVRTRQRRGRMAVWSRHPSTSHRSKSQYIQASWWRMRWYRPTWMAHRAAC